ncbi:MAG: hypothetical protein GF388_00100 [Candidatus Aegiribacteria sp.]|nr:hypothetical protein [Candidatus Aegiribacteria sp.]
MVSATNFSLNISTVCSFCWVFLVSLASYCIARNKVRVQRNIEEKNHSKFVEDLKKRYEENRNINKEQIEKAIKNISKTNTSSLMVVWQLVKESPLDKMVFHAGMSASPLLFTLNTGKVYVGIPQTFAEPNEKSKPNQEIRLFPIFSGYRKADTMQFKKTTDYTVLGEKEAKLEIVIPQESIVATSFYDEENSELFDNV